MTKPAGVAFQLAGLCFVLLAGAAVMVPDAPAALFFGAGGALLLYIGRTPLRAQRRRDRAEQRRPPFLYSNRTPAASVYDITRRRTARVIELDANRATDAAAARVAAESARIKNQSLQDIFRRLPDDPHG